MFYQNYQHDTIANLTPQFRKYLILAYELEKIQSIPPSINPIKQIPILGIDIFFIHNRQLFVNSKLCDFFFIFIISRTHDSSVISERLLNNSTKIIR